MTAPAPKVTLTPEVHAYFADYLKREIAWGIYHVWLSDGNWDSDAPEVPYGGWEQDCYARPVDVAMWALFRDMTPSQRRRVARRAEAANHKPSGGKSDVAPAKPPQGPLADLGRSRGACPVCGEDTEALQSGMRCFSCGAERSY